MRKRRLQLFILLLSLLYVGTYLGLSRRGYAEAERYGMKGFYYFAPEDSFRWRFGNLCCQVAFKPLNAVDCWLGFGMSPAFEPLWGLSR